MFRARLIRAVDEGGTVAGAGGHRDDAQFRGAPAIRVEDADSDGVQPSRQERSRTSFLAAPYRAEMPAVHARPRGRRELTRDAPDHHLAGGDGRPPGSADRGAANAALPTPPATREIDRSGGNGDAIAALVVALLAGAGWLRGGGPEAAAVR